MLHGLFALGLMMASQTCECPTEAINRDRFLEFRHPDPNLPALEVAIQPQEVAIGDWVTIEGASAVPCQRVVFIFQERSSSAKNIPASIIIGGVNSDCNGRFSHKFRLDKRMQSAAGGSVDVSPEASYLLITEVQRGRQVSFTELKTK